MPSLSRACLFVCHLVVYRCRAHPCIVTQFRKAKSDRWRVRGPGPREQLVPRAPAAHVSALVCLELSPVVSREYQNNHNSILRRVVTSDIRLEDLCFV